MGVYRKPYKYLGILSERLPEMLERKNHEELKFIAMCYYSYVEKKAKELGKNIDEQEELIQVGMESVMKILYSKFSANYKFSITLHIESKVTSAMKHYLDSSYRLSDTSNIDAVIKRLTEELNRKPTTEEVLKELSFGEKKLYLAMISSLQEELSYYIDDDVEKELALDIIYQEAANIPNERNKYIFNSFYGINGYEKKSDMVLSAELNTSRQYIQYIVKYVTKNIKSAINTEQTNRKLRGLK